MVAAAAAVPAWKCAQRSTARAVRESRWRRWVGAMASLATVYDMCKAVDKGMVIGDVRVVRKVGGRHDYGEEAAEGK